ncbi:MAG TPA: GFA family protein [Caulobacteraceae bacterium]|nr:GFA family protein [Caulobacteraceae bacterium]
MPSLAISGGCLCGRVRYACATAPLMGGICYCRDCQHASGGPFAAVVVLPDDALAISGQLAEFKSSADSGNTITRKFCPECGSQILWSGPAAPGMVVIPVGSLDNPDLFRPTASFYTSSAPRWAPQFPDTERYPKGPERVDGKHDLRQVLGRDPSLGAAG